MDIPGEKPAAPQRPRKRRPWWLYIGAPALAVLLIVGVVLSVVSDNNDRTQRDRDIKARSAAISAQLALLDKKTYGAITLRGGFDPGEWNNGHVKLKLNVGKCQPVDAYAATPKRPERTDQAVLHILVPGENTKAPTADMQVRGGNDGDLFELKDTLQVSGLKHCVASDWRLFPLDG